MVETPQCALFSRFQSNPGHRIGKVGEFDGDGLIEVGRAVSLDADVEGVLEAGRKRFGETVGGHRGEADFAAARAVVGEEAVGRDVDFHSC